MKTNCGQKPVLVIVAAGSSSRMGGQKKEYMPFSNGTVLSSSVRIFLETLDFSTVAVTYPKSQSAHDRQNELEKSKKAIFADPFIKSLYKTSSVDFLFVEGGKSRQESVFNALAALRENLFFPKANRESKYNPIVFIHDGARPFIEKQTILSVFENAEKFGASCPGIPPVDTQKIIDEENFIHHHLVRSQISAIQTPQAFYFDGLFKSHLAAKNSNKEYTDDTEIWNLIPENPKVKVTAGSEKNKKITFPQDLNLLETNIRTQKMIRTGIGYDKHPLVKGRPLLLGGIALESDFGEDGHSDGDVLLHAISDALLGASGLGDIGSFFPPEDSQWKNADSKKLLSKIWSKIKNEGWNLSNLDCVVILEKPKFLPYREQVINSIAEILHTDKDRVFVKAKTGEKMGDVGKGLAVEVFASCLLEK